MATYSAGAQRTLTRPLYVPEEGRQVLERLKSAAPSRFMDELERLAGLGSPWASAALAYLHLLPGPDGTRDVTRATELCKKYADAGDPYALFVFAWASLFSGKRFRAITSMKKAALSGFPPATVDFATFVWNGWGMKERYPAAALELLGRAQRAGHKAAFVWRCRFYMSGQFGLLRRVFGYAALVIAVSRYLLAVRRDPYSSKVFLFAAWLKAPAIQPEHPHADADAREEQGGAV
jgi:TPR repeat protein